MSLKNWWRKDNFKIDFDKTSDKIGFQFNSISIIQYHTEFNCLSFSMLKSYNCRRIQWWWKQHRVQVTSSFASSISSFASSISLSNSSYSTSSNSWLSHDHCLFITIEFTHSCHFLDAIAFPRSYPCQWVSEYDW